MKHWLYSLRRMRGLPDGWHALALAMLLFPFCPAAAKAEISGAVAATGWRNGVPVISPPAQFRLGLEEQNPSLALRADQGSVAFFRGGEEIRFEVSLTNTGNVTLHSPIIEVDAPATGISCPEEIAVLPGEEYKCTATAIAGPAEIEAGSLSIAMNAIAMTPHGSMIGPVQAEIVVEWPKLTARDDIGEAADGIVGTADLLNVLANDELDGRPVDPEEVELVLAAPEGPITLNAEGVAGVVGRTPAGEYRIPYRVCLAQMPRICSEAAASIKVLAPALQAMDDSVPELADGTSGSPDFLDLIANDLRGDLPVRRQEVEIAETGQSPGSYLRIDTDGLLTVPPGTPAGTYVLDYRICDRVNPGNCDEARATVEVDAPASIFGTVFLDRNGSGAFEPDEDRPEEGLEITLHAPSGDIIRTFSGAGGKYSLESLPAATGYRMILRDAGGRVLRGVKNLDLLPGQLLTDVDLPADPAGHVYDAVSREPIAGARIRVTDADGALLPQRCLLDPAQQGQITGTDGAYYLALAAGSDPACPAQLTSYRIEVSLPESYEPGPSVILPPLPEDLTLSECIFDPVPGGWCQASTSARIPSANMEASYLLEFLATAGDAMPLHNHIPLDPLPGDDLLALEIRPATQETGPGGRIALEIGILNKQEVTSEPLALTSRLPVGFTYAAGSATLNGRHLEPERDGADLVFRNLQIPATEKQVLRLVLEASGTVRRGNHALVSRLLNRSGRKVTMEADASISIRPGEFAVCTDISGRVFVDRDQDGQDDGRERGLGEIRLQLESGLATWTDDSGGYRFSCVDLARTPSGMRLLLDEESLSGEYLLTSDNPQMIASGGSSQAKADFAVAALRVVRLDLGGAAFETGADRLEPRWLDGIARLVDLLAGEPSMLRMSYRAQGEDPALIRERLRAVSELVQESWTEIGSPYPLDIREEIAQ